VPDFRYSLAVVTLPFEMYALRSHEVQYEQYSEESSWSGIGDVARAHTHTSTSVVGRRCPRGLRCLLRHSFFVMMTFDSRSQSSSHHCVRMGD
jgi:hypothetical protein